MERIIFIFKSMHLFQHAGLIKKKYTIFTVGAIKNGQPRETGNIWYTRRKKNKNKNTTQYVLDTTMCKQTHIA